MPATWAGRSAITRKLHQSAAFSHLGQSAVQDLSSGGDVEVGTVNMNLGSDLIAKAVVVEAVILFTAEAECQFAARAVAFCAVRAGCICAAKVEFLCAARADWFFASRTDWFFTAKA
ncbi:hypothetical protein V6N11_056721 [Hibiscus sabdariffa]|uniref:Uncharacterized protein n=1 Tax=Hibiscus sabdariffa TaxID=183260 RepID=A0ABR2T4P7_9ROSI